LAVADRISAWRAAEELAVLVLEGPFTPGDTDVANPLGDPGGNKNVHAIGGKAESSTCVVGAGRSFKDLNIEARRLEEKSEDGTCNSTADDKCAFRIDSHG
jgi:hypothetical protein